MVEEVVVFFGFILLDLYLCDVMSRKEWRSMSLKELELLLSVKMDELYALRMEIARRKGDVPQSRGSVDFEQYVTR